MTRRSVFFVYLSGGLTVFAAAVLLFLDLMGVQIRTRSWVCLGAAVALFLVTLGLHIWIQRKADR